MEPDPFLDSRPGNRHRSFNGCWTCRLRRKKCDEKRPVCDVCASLHITCFIDQEKPEWMDGGARQAEMAGRLRRQVKEQAARRRGEPMSEDYGPDLSTTHSAGAVKPPLRPSVPSPHSSDDRCNLLGEELRAPAAQAQPTSRQSISSAHQRIGCILGNGSDIALGRSDIVHLTFYLDQLFPFLFPFYRPSVLHGGKAWLLELMLSSPVVRQAILCQSSYFFSLTQGPSGHEICWQKLLGETRSTFEVLRRALEVITEFDIKDHLHGAVRVLSSIMQIQRFDIALMNFSACQVHLGAAVALFRQLLDSQMTVSPAQPFSGFESLMSQLNLTPESIISVDSPAVVVAVAEQAALQFSAALLLVDDIIASMMLQKQPKLYDYHAGLLGEPGNVNTPIRLEKVMGCQNWVLRQIGKIAALDAWKLQCKDAGSLDILELVRRATNIKSLLETGLIRLDDKTDDEKGDAYLPSAWPADCQQQQASARTQALLVTRVWAHAALIYLLIVVSGWQPASGDVRFHVQQVVDILTCQISPPALLRTMVWPMCVAGFLADETEESRLRASLASLQPPSLFGTVRKALEIMEKVWSSRSCEDSADRDLAACFRSESGELILLV